MSPSNPQVAQGTAQQFTLRSLAPGGQLHDRTLQAKWTLALPGRPPLPMPSDGLLQLTEPGRYHVTAQYGEHTLATVVTVTAATLTAVAISPSAPRVAKGLSQAFTATAQFSDGTTQDVTRLAAWSVKDVMGMGVATINTLGVATAKNPGKTRISARYKTVTATASLEVTAAALLALAVSPSNPTVAKGSSQPFTASGTYSDGSVLDVTADADWAVADLVGSGVASIDGVGVAAGQAVGQATVSAAYDGQVAETKLTVTAAAVVSLAVSPSTATRAKGTTQAFVATATFSDGSRQDVTAVGTWTTTDVVGSGVAAVDHRGLATANAVGTATLFCRYRGSAASATLQVTPAVLTGLQVQPAAVTLAKGLTQGFTVMGRYSDGSQQDLSTLAAWTTLDVVGTDIASVNSAGLTLGKNVGKATVTASYLGKSASGTLTVTAATLASLALTPVGPVINKGDSQQFRATGTFSDGSKLDLTNLASWTATDLFPSSGVATVSASGRATGNQEGKATIAAQYLGVTAATVLTVHVRSGICSPDGWCWRNALPQGNELRATWGNAANNLWAVGDVGTIVKGDYDSPIRTYTDPRMEMSCGLPRSPTSVTIETLTQVM